MISRLRENRWLIPVILVGIMAFSVVYIKDLVSMVRFVYGILFPFLMGALYAFVLNILMVRYEKLIFSRVKSPKLLKLKRPVGIFLSLFTVFAILTLVLVLVIPQIIQAVKTLTRSLPVLFWNIQNLIWDLTEKYPELNTYTSQFKNIGDTIRDTVLPQIGNLGGGIVSAAGTVFGELVNFFLAFIFSIYLLAGKEKLQRNFTKLFRAFLSEKKSERLFQTARLANRTFGNFFIGQLTEVLINGAMCTIGMLILRLPYASMIGSVVGLSAMIPVFGAYIGTAVGIIMLLTVSPMKALIFLIFIVCMQQLDGNLIYPRVVGGSVGLPGMWVLVAVTLGGGLFGIIGILLGVPTFSTVYQILRRETNRRLKKKGIRQEEVLEKNTDEEDPDDEDVPEAGDLPEEEDSRKDDQAAEQKEPAGENTLPEEKDKKE